MSIPCPTHSAGSHEYTKTHTKVHTYSQTHAHTVKHTTITCVCTACSSAVCGRGNPPFPIQHTVQVATDTQTQTQKYTHTYSQTHAHTVRRTTITCVGTACSSAVCGRGNPPFPIQHTVQVATDTQTHTQKYTHTYSQTHAHTVRRTTITCVGTACSSAVCGREICPFPIQHTVQVATNTQTHTQKYTHILTNTRTHSQTYYHNLRIGTACSSAMCGRADSPVPPRRSVSLYWRGQRVRFFICWYGMGGGVYWPRG